MAFTNDDGNFVWNGIPYFDRLRDALPSLPPLDGVADSQLCWTGYDPSTDRFLVGFDLWLEYDDDVADDDREMGAALVFVTFSRAGDELTATVDSVERAKMSFYSGHLLDSIATRFPEHIEVDLD